MSVEPIEKMNKYSNSALTTSQKKIAAKALGAAFAQDAFMTYLFPNPITREQNLTTLFLPVIQCSSHYGDIELAAEGKGALAWISGKYLPLPLFQLLRNGFIWIPLKIGFPAFRRLQNHDGFCEHEIISRAPKDFAYLWVVGVHPEAAGQGLGKRLIQSALNTMRNRGHSACLLRTDNEKNVSLYEYLGFKLVHTDIAPKSNLQYWVLSQELV